MWSTLVMTTASLVLGVTLFGCGGATVGSLDAAKQFATALCAKLESCDKTAFGKAYSSQAECVTKGTSGQTNDTVSGCSQSGLDTCVSDTKALNCSDVKLTDPTTYTPGSCKNC